MNDLEVYFKENNKRVLHKWTHYFEIYDNHFKRFRGKEVVLLEAGVSHGGSLQMWKHYFGEKAKIYGLDINPNCKEVQEEQIEVFIGSQSDRKFLKNIRKKLPKIDILIDDGGHTMLQQIILFEELFESVSDEGVYLIEDLHTSYWKSYGGGYKNKHSFIEYSKNFIDQLNAFHSRQKHFREDNFTRTTNSLHYYDSVLVIEKRNRTKTDARMTGNIKIKTLPINNIDEETFRKSSALRKLFLRWQYFKSMHEGFVLRGIFNKVLERLNSIFRS